MYKKYFKTIGLAIIIPIVFLYAFQQGASLAYNYWLSVWADDPVVNGTQIDTDLKLAVFGALGFVQGRRLSQVYIHSGRPPPGRWSHNYLDLVLLPNMTKTEKYVFACFM